MLRTTDLAQLLLQRSVRPGDWVVDATVGNARDTLFLANLVGPSGRVFGFDVQHTALAIALDRVKGLPQVTLINRGHEIFTDLLPLEAKDRLTAVIFNLGYLPGAPKTVTTRASTTIRGLNQALSYIAVHGQINVVVYRGHPEGDKEAVAVRSFVERLPSGFSAILCQRTQSLRPAPELFFIERLR